MMKRLRIIIQLVQTEPQSTTRVMVVAEMVQKKLCLIHLRNFVPRSVNTATATRTVTTPFAKLDEKAQDHNTTRFNRN
jgi:hypothetical protein